LYSSLEEHQKSDAFCIDLVNKVQGKAGAAANFQIHKGLVCYFPKRARRRWWVVPPPLRQMLLKYFHETVMAGHLGARKMFYKIAANFWWPKMRTDIFAYVRQCELCQRAKSAQDTGGISFCGTGCATDGSIVYRFCRTFSSLETR
jgi:hypothetical protein